MSEREINVNTKHYIRVCPDLEITMKRQVMALRPSSFLAGRAKPSV